VKGLAVAGIALALAGSAGGHTLVERVHTTPKRRPANGCAFLVSAPLVGGGKQTTCITHLDGVPGPGVVMHSRGRMTFRLKKGSIRARVRITQRFAPDGVHAHQSIRGSIAGGTRTYRGSRGTLGGGGTVVDRPGGLGPVDLRYTLRLVRG
jgi:hypothetical protein